MASLLVARAFRLPEAYWAPLTTLVITQSSLGAALAVSWQRFTGTILGALAGAIVATYLSHRVLVFGITIFFLGLICAVLGADRSAYRFACITLAVVLLIPRATPPWQIALHRFAEVSIGIVVALISAMLWPDREVSAAPAQAPAAGS